MRFRSLSCLSVGLASLLILQPTATLFAQQTGSSNQQAIQQYYIPPSHEPKLSQEQLNSLVRQKIKYVFVLYQENRSFDSYFGTYPKAEGLFTHSAAETPGFTQKLVDTNGSAGTIQPFRIGPAQYAADTDDIDHSHPRIVAKMDIQADTPKMDQFAVTEEKKYSPTGNPSIKAKQFGELAMAYEDCDTVPILWQYANRFVLFDHIFQTMTGPSTPGNLSIIAAQTGQTQWALHPNQGYPDNGASAPGVPVLNDDDPLWGSPSDLTPANEKLPVNPTDYPGYGTQLNMTFASLPLTLQGANLKNTVTTDRDPDGDLGDVKDDVQYIAALNNAAVPFGWYEEGFDKESTDSNSGPVTADGSHASYITHHNGPQYFGYVANNPKMSQQLHGLGDFFQALDNKTLPAQGGLFYVKGGYTNLFGLKPTNPDATVQKNFLGDDDHPAYSDAQISEAMTAEAVNRIAASPYWSQSAIIITWDDSEGDYDHVPPPVRSMGPDNSVITDGPRVPLLLISPYSRTNYIASAQGSHSSVVKFVNTVFNLPPLALLPDEVKARKLGEREFGQRGLGPEDALTSGITDLTGAFSPSRLIGTADVLPSSYVQIPESMISQLPAQTGYGCSTLGITTTDRALGIPNMIPSDFNPRPSTNPTK